LSFAASPVRADTPNLIANPGFEQTLAPWVWDDASGIGNPATDASARDTVNPHSGQYALRAGAGHVTYNALPVSAGKALELRFWARGVSNSAPVTIVFAQFNTYRVLFRVEINFTDDWQEYVCRTVLPADLNLGGNPLNLAFWLHTPGYSFWLDDVSLHELPAQEGGDMPVANPVRNHSFEAGADGWTAVIRAPEFDSIYNPGDTGAAYPTQPGAKLETPDTYSPHGRRHLRVAVANGHWGVLTSAYFPARYGHASKLTFQARYTSGGSRTVVAGVSGGKNNITFQSATVTMDGTWKKHTVPLTPSPSDSGVYVVRLRLGAGDYELDDFEFVEDAQAAPVLHPPSTAIQPAAGTPAGNLFAPGDTASFNLVVANETASATLGYRLSAVDFAGRVVAEKTVSVTTDAGGYGGTAFTMPGATLGAFRVEARRSTGGTVLAEQIYSVLPGLPEPAARPDSFFGAHVDLTPYNLEIARRAGFRWLRLHGPLATKWMAVEPAQGRWRFGATRVPLDAAKALGFQLLGSLDTAPDWAADIDTTPGAIANRWCNSYPPADYTRWKTYVTRICNEADGLISAWELWNEPDGGFLQVNPGSALPSNRNKKDTMLALFAATREAVNATGRPLALIGPGTGQIDPALSWQVLDAGAGAQLDAYSFHHYNNLAGGGGNPDAPTLLAALGRYRAYDNRAGAPLPLWHTEGGPWLSGGQSWLATSRAPASTSTTAPQAAGAMVRAALFFKASGVLRHFVFHAGASETGRDMQLDATSACIEVTGIPGPGIAAHAAMAALTEDAAPAGFESPGGGVSVAHFTGAGASDADVDVYWSTTARQLSSLASLRPGDTVHDMMGNPVAASAATTGEFPLYVRRAPAGTVNLPDATTAGAGGNITFSAPAAGNPAPVIRWEYQDGAAWKTVTAAAPFTYQLAGNGATLTLTAVTGALNTLRFRYVADLGGGVSFTSNAASITVTTPYRPGAQALAPDAAGALYVANTAQNTIDIIGADGMARTLAGDPAGTAGWLDATGTQARFKQPGGVAALSGTLYIADTGNNVVRARALATRAVTTLAGNAGAPATDAARDGDKTTARLKAPAGIAVNDGAPRIIFAADSQSHTIRAITPDGAITTIAGEPGASGSDAAHLNTPLGLALAGDGALYVADSANHAIRKITANPAPGSGFTMTTFAGALGQSGTNDGATATARFDTPSGVAFASGAVFVADTGNSTLRKIAGGTVTTLAGRAKTPGATDNDASGAQARFNAPRGLAPGSDGEIYVADTGNKTIRILLDPDTGATATPALVTPSTPAGDGGGGGDDDGGGNNSGGGGVPGAWFFLALVMMAIARRFAPRP
jgi:hypothetical protein